MKGGITRGVDYPTAVSGLADVIASETWRNIAAGAAATAEYRRQKQSLAAPVVAGALLFKGSAIYLFTYWFLADYDKIYTAIREKTNISRHRRKAGGDQSRHIIRCTH